MKKILSTILSVCMAVCVATLLWSTTEMNVFAETLSYLPYEGASYELIYEVGEDGITITGYTGTAMGELVLPEKIDGVNVVRIGYGAFEDCSDFVGKLIIPEGVTSIESWAFYACGGFDGELSLPSTLSHIGMGAFWLCEGFSGDLIIPENVKEIESSAFRYCSGFTGNLILGNELTTIGAYAFFYCSGFCGNLVIPEGITIIEASTFEGCKGFNGELIISNSVTIIESNAFCYCEGFKGDLVIPESVITINSAAFNLCSGFDGKLVMSDGLTTIGYSAFFGCEGLEGDLIIPNSVEYIGDYAFDGCSNFTGSLHIPQSVTSIGTYAFLGCKSMNRHVYLEGDVNSIAGNAFLLSLSGISQDSETVRKEITIHAPKGSQGELYANENGYNFSESMTTSEENIIEPGQSEFVESTLSVDYSNQLNNNYPEMFGSCRTSFVGELLDGGYQTVVYDSGILYIENFNSSYQSVIKKQLKLELPIWGGLLLGEKYNYVVCGDNYDPTQENGGIVYRVIQYDKDFNRIDSLSYNGMETYTNIPFDAGNVSMDENGDVLTVYTSRARLDGHQSNIVLRIITKDMSKFDSGYSSVHVSHSFRQIFKYDGKTAVYVDLSDSIPKRSVYIQFGNIGKALMEIAGKDGYNITNAEVSGMEISDTHYLVVGTYLNNDSPNVFLACINKTTGEVTQQWLTDSTVFTPKYLHNPRIIKIEENKFVVMWGTLLSGVQSARYIIVDASGKVLGGIKEQVGAEITDCEPIFSDNKVVWLSVENGKKTFQEIIDFSETGIFELRDSIVESVNPWDGITDVSWYNDSDLSFVITTPQQLAGLAELVNAGNSFEGKTVNLVNDIFMNDESYSYVWTPICNWKGTFNGNGKSIYNLKVNEDAVGGLFGVINEGGIVKAVDLVQGIFNCGGCVADVNKGIIAFCNNYSLVGSSDNAGGICNVNYNLIYGCKNYGEVWGSEVGGIVYQNMNTTAVVSQCSNWGLVAGIHDVGGIAGSNYGWMYNCYNRGLLTNSYLGSGPNKGESISGIVFYNAMGNDVESCYSIGAYVYDEELYRGAHAINYEGDPFKIVNCYTSPMNGFSDEAIVLTSEQIKSSYLVEKLNIQTNTVLPAWMSDVLQINEGYPITIADYNYACGRYKIQPELWMTNEKTITMSIGEVKDIQYSCYYNEEAPIITVDNGALVGIEYDNGCITLKALGKGTTYLNIRFVETDNNIGQVHQIKLVINEYPVEDNPFLDVDETDWYYDSTIFTYKKGIMTGITEPDSAGLVQFAPEEPIPREQFVTVLYKKVKPGEVSYTNRFADVQAGTWYTSPVLWAETNGIVNGIDERQYGVGQLITREQIATMLWRYATEYEGYDTSILGTVELSSFQDGGQVSSWAKIAMQWAIERGIITGKLGNTGGNLLDPSGFATRAECATMLQRFIKVYE